MSNVYTDCTVCNATLTKEEIEKNESEGNLYYSICDNCLEKAKKRVFDILKNAESPNK